MCVDSYLWYSLYCSWRVITMIHCGHFVEYWICCVIIQLVTVVEMLERMDVMMDEDGWMLSGREWWKVCNMHEVMVHIKCLMWIWEWSRYENRGEKMTFIHVIRVCDSFEVCVCDEYRIHIVRQAYWFLNRMVSNREAINPWDFDMIGVLLNRSYSHYMDSIVGAIRAEMKICIVKNRRMK